MTTKPANKSPEGDRLMLLQGFTRAFFKWVLKEQEDDHVYKAFAELLAEYQRAEINEKIFFVMLEMGLKDEIVDEAGVERLRNAVLKNNIPLYQWMVEELNG